MLVASLAVASASAQTSITVQPESAIGTIEPEVYGQFLEHLGAQLYDGLWVGKDSEVANTGGVRTDVLEALDTLSIPLIRWPGGCFADIYHWRDGIGERTPRVNMSWGGTPEPNTFGTHEFFDLAERLGAKTYLNVNLGSGTVQEAADWLEYITSDSQSALAKERRANGRDEPWTIDYLSIGNETWGCGGHIRPEAYADLYVQWATFLKTEGEQPVRIVSGSHDGNLDYSDEVLDHPNIGDLAEGVSVHYYTLPTGDWADKGEGTGFDEESWARTIERTLRMEDIIAEQIAMIDGHDALGEAFGLYVDEWGVWVNTPEDEPALRQQNTIREAVVAALNFHVFHAYADRVPMTNIAQMVNVLQAMILTEGDEMLLTPTYHAYEMYVPFQGAEALGVEMDAPTFEVRGASVPALSVTAARRADGALLIGLVNADPASAHEVELSRPEGAEASGRVLTGASVDAHNTFDEPERVVPAPAEIEARSDTFAATLPPRSVSVWTIE